MNPWTALVIGLVLGWLIEFAIDWFFWRRKSTSEQEYEELQNRLAAAEARVTELESGVILTEDEAGLEPAEIDFETGEVTDEYAAGEETAVEGEEFDSTDEDDLTAEGIAAAGVAAAVVAGTDAETTPEEIEKAPADELDEEIATAFAVQAGGELLDEQPDTEIDSGDEEFDSAEEYAAAGLTAAAIADEGDEPVLQELEMELSDDLVADSVAEQPAAEFDSVQDFDSAEEIAAAGVVDEVKADAFEDTIPGEMEAESVDSFEAEAQTAEMETFSDESESGFAEEQAAAEYDSLDEELETAEEISDSASEPDYMTEGESEMAAADEDFSETADPIDERGADQ